MSKFKNRKIKLLTRVLSSLINQENKISILRKLISDKADTDTMLDLGFDYDDISKIRDEIKSKNAKSDPSICDPCNVIRSFDFLYDYMKGNDIEENMTMVPLEDLCTVTTDLRSYEDNEGYWHVYPIYTTDTKVAIVCPHCGQVHTHSNTNGKYEGHRVSHCFKGNGYIIEDINNLSKQSI